MIFEILFNNKALALASLALLANINMNNGSTIAEDPCHRSEFKITLKKIVPLPKEPVVDYFVVGVANATESEVLDSIKPENIKNNEIFDVLNSPIQDGQYRFNGTNYEWVFGIPRDIFDVNTFVEDTNNNTADDKVMQEVADAWKCVIMDDRDLLIHYYFEEIDGAGDCYDLDYQQDQLGGGMSMELHKDGLTKRGLMKFDSYNMEAMRKAGTLNKVIMHEMGHVLGIGSTSANSPWLKLISDNCLEKDEADLSEFVYKGKRGQEVFKELGFDQTGVSEENATNAIDYPKLLIENTMGGGSKCAHFNEAQLVSEMMTTDSVPKLVLSKFSIAILEDLGYNVDYSTAEEFTPAIVKEDRIKQTEINEQKKADRIPCPKKSTSP
eukprot:Pgem_evm1s10026